jgi:hypothetical protein
MVTRPLTPTPKPVDRARLAPDSFAEAALTFSAAPSETASDIT